MPPHSLSQLCWLSIVLMCSKQVWTWELFSQFHSHFVLEVAGKAKFALDWNSDVADCARKQAGSLLNAWTPGLMLIGLRFSAFSSCLALITRCLSSCCVALPSNSLTLTERIPVSTCRINLALRSYFKQTHLPFHCSNSVHLFMYTAHSIWIIGCTKYTHFAAYLYTHFCVYLLYSLMFT